jgi:O-antigen/teichoic acid export membrane protein
MASLFRNTLAQGATFVSSQFYSFLLAPIMIGRLGLTLFGVWTVVGVIANYASILDGGITRALARFIALHHANDDEQAIRECVGLGLAAFTVLGLLLVPVAWFAGPPLAGVLGHVTGRQLSEILVASAVIFLVQGYSAVLQALPQGLLRMVPPNTAVVLGNTVNFAASVGALAASRSLVVYAWANAAAETVSALFVLISLRFVWRSGLIALPSRERAKEVLAYSAKSQLGWIASLINLQSDTLVIGLLVGVRAAGTYQLGSSVAGAIRAVGVISISAMIPTATRAIAHEGRAAVRRLTLRYMPIVLGTTFPIFVITGLTAPFVFIVWIGHISHGVVPIVIALNAAFALNIATGVPSTISLADNRPGFVSRNAVQMAVLNLALTVALAPVLGLAGVVAGTVVAVALLSVMFIVSFARSYDIRAGELRDAVLPPALLSTALAVPFVPLVLATRHLGDTRFSALVVLAAFVAGYGAIYWPLASWLRLLPERLLLRRPISRSAAY